MPVALHTVSYAGLWGQAALIVEETFAKAAELGFDGVLVMAKRPHTGVLELSPSRCEALRGLAAELGLEILGLAGYTDFLAASRGAEVPLLEYQLAAVDRLCEACAALGGRYVRIFTAYPPVGSDPLAARRRVVEALREAAAGAERHGVVLGLQNHHDLAVDSADFAALLSEVGHPALRAMFDAWSPALRGEDLYQAARRLAPQTVNTTVADYVLVPRWEYLPQAVNYRSVEPPEARAVPLGEGMVAYEPFWCGLLDGGYDGWVTYEMCSPLRDGNSMDVLDRYARHALETIRSW